MSATPIPAWRRYLDSLPNGIDSHPECMVKGSVVRSIVETISDLGRLDLDSLPPPAAVLFRQPPLPTAWTSEVAYHVLMLACQEGMPQKDLDEWVFDRNRRLLRTSLYRVLFLLVSPERLFVGLTQRWGMFRRGSHLSMVRLTKTGAHLGLKFPPRLHSAVTLRNVAIAIAAAGEAAGAVDVTFKVSDLTEVDASIRFEWT